MRDGSISTERDGEDVNDDPNMAGVVNVAVCAKALNAVLTKETVTRMSVAEVHQLGALQKALSSLGAEPVVFVVQDTEDDARVQSVHRTAESAMAAYPVGEDFEIERPGGWQREVSGVWWNGCNWKDSKIVKPFAVNR